MNRRDLFKGIIGAAAAVPVAKAAAPKLATKPIPAAEVRVAPAVELTAKQREVIYALLNPDVKMVLFSGGRGCGRTTVAQEWAKSLAPLASGMHLALVPDRFTRIGWKNEVRRKDLYYGEDSPDIFRGIGRFKRMIIDDAHTLEEEALEFIRYELLSEPNSKILITAVPDGGAGHKWLRKHFPLIGWNWKGTGNYHVNASTIVNPYWDSIKAQLNSGSLGLPAHFVEGKW